MILRLSKSVRFLIICDGTQSRYIFVADVLTGLTVLRLLKEYIHHQTKERNNNFFSSWAQSTSHLFDNDDFCFARSHIYQVFISLHIAAAWWGMDSKSDFRCETSLMTWARKWKRMWIPVEFSATRVDGVYIYAMSAVKFIY